MSESIKSYSQACQDLYVKTVLKNKKNGYYLEIGSNHPTVTSNTYMLEKDFDWSGISVELQSEMVNLFNLTRKNKCFQHDATTFDFAKALNENAFPKQIDYLSLDIEPPSQTYLCLTRLPLKHYRFSVITFEHDYYYAGEEYKTKAYDLLISLGYERVISNVKYSGLAFEDWYVDPTVLSPESWQALRSENIESTSINFKMEQK